MNSFFGVLIGGMLWMFTGCIASWFLLEMYDGARFPMDDISADDKKSNRHLRVKYSIVSGFLVALFWFVAVHNNNLISN